MREWRSLEALNPENVVIKNTGITNVLVHFVMEVFAVQKAPGFLL
jgi:hypothetical protein